MPEEKTALVTGATRGIGKAIALALGQQGMTVIGTATSDEGAQKISDYLAAANVKGTGMRLNVRDADGIDDFLKTVNDNFAAPNVLVNNAGITQDNLLLRMKPEQWDAVIDTNLNSIYRLSKACLRSMLKSRWGRIVNITSVVGVTGNPGQANYCAAKAGLIGFGKSLAQEIAGHGITVNAVAPGFIDTDMTQALNEQQREMIYGKIPMKRMGTPDEIANAVRFLVSDEAAYITGQTLHVNGGLCMV